MLFQSCFSLKQSCFRAVQGCFPLIQRCSALVKIRHILVWNSKNTLINTTFALFSVHFLLKTLYFSLFTILQGTCDQEAWGRGWCVNSNFWLEFRRNDFFHSWYTPKKTCFSWSQYLFELTRSIFVGFSLRFDPALIQRKPALNSSETALISAGFLNPFWNSTEQRWFRENQRWTALKQRWSALVFLTHSETALISAEIFEISETTLFSADLLWDFNPGSLDKLRQPTDAFVVTRILPDQLIANTVP